jgi:hypothetical protein
MYGLQSSVLRHAAACSKARQEEHAAQVLACASVHLQGTFQQQQQQHGMALQKQHPQVTW